MQINQFVLTSHGKIGRLVEPSTYIVKDGDDVKLETTNKEEALGLCHKNSTFTIEEIASSILFNKNVFKVFSNQLSEVKSLILRIYSDKSKHVRLEMEQNNNFLELINALDKNNITYRLNKS